MFTNTLAIVALAGVASAHIGLYHEAMFCKNGYSNEDQQNNNEVSNPLLNQDWNGFWFHGDCKNYPPESGKYMELPAGGKAVGELAGNRGQTSLSFDGRYSGLWPDGADHSNYDDGSWSNQCIVDPNLHTENRTRAAGTVLAIAYTNDIHNVKYEDLVVISVAEETPWHRKVEYEIPADLPACDDCICAYSWIPNGCGIPNMYMNGVRCRVTGARPDAPKIGKAKPATWCEGDETACLKGPKGITIFNQNKDINTVDLSGKYQADGQEASPGYNKKMGFYAGAQLDIFEAGSTTPTVPSAPGPAKPVPPIPEPTDGSSTPTVPSAPGPARPVPPTPEPTESCIVNTGKNGHRRHQRRLVSLWKFSINLDDGEEA